MLRSYPTYHKKAVAMQHTVSSYDGELKALNQSILDMCAKVIKQVEIAVKALQTRDQKLVDKTDRIDKEINQLEREVEDQATIVLALRNPMAVDLRFVTASLKMSTVLERMGDIAKKIAGRAMEMESVPEEAFMKKLEIMAKVVLEMIGTVRESIDTRDLDKAKAVWARDDEMDSLYENFFREVQERMIANPKEAKNYTHIIFAAKNFERMGDYATNLAKSVNYIASGTRSFRKPAGKAS